MADQLLHFTACGLIFDVFGVLLLGFAFFFKTKKSIVQEAGTYWDANPHVLRSIIASKFDGMVGTVLLFIGFIYQILGYSNFNYMPLIIASYILLLIFLMLYLFKIRSLKVQKWHDELLNKFEKQ